MYESKRVVIRVLLALADVIIVGFGVCTTEKLLTQHGDNHLRVWGVVITRDANRLSDLQLVFFYLVNLAYVATACSAAIQYQQPGGWISKARCLYETAQMPTYQGAGNRLLIVAWVGLERTLMSVGLLSGSVSICVVTAAVFTMCMQSIPDRPRALRAADNLEETRI